MAALSSFAAGRAVQSHSKRHGKDLLRKLMLVIMLKRALQNSCRLIAKPRTTLTPGFSQISLVIAPALAQTLGASRAKAFFPAINAARPSLQISSLIHTIALVQFPADLTYPQNTLFKQGPTP